MKRCLSLILALVLTVSLLPSVLAADPLSGFPEAAVDESVSSAAETILRAQNSFKMAGYPSIDDPAAADDDTLILYACWNMRLGAVPDVKQDDYISHNGCTLLYTGYKNLQNYMELNYNRTLDLSAYEVANKPSKSELIKQVELNGTGVSLNKLFVFDGAVYTAQPPEAPPTQVVKNCRYYDAGAGYLVSFDLFDETGATHLKTSYAVLRKAQYGCQLVNVYDGLPSGETVAAALETPAETAVPDEPATPAAPAETAVPGVGLVAKRTTSPLMINGHEAAISAYNINDSNYYKLRDLAVVLSGTNCRFAIGWDGAKKAITVTPGQSYTKVGGELTNPGPEDKIAQVSPSVIILRGKQVKLNAYMIGGNNYFKLRDLGELLNFKVSWNASDKVINVTTPN